LGPTAAIISIAQQEIPIGMGHNELDRPQLIKASNRVVKIDSPSFDSKPIILLISAIPRLAYFGFCVIGARAIAANIFLGKIRAKLGRDSL
jgi:hypothetical protein